MLKDYRITDAH